MVEKFYLKCPNCSSNNFKVYVLYNNEPIYDTPNEWGESYKFICQSCDIIIAELHRSKDHKLEFIYNFQR